MLTVTGAPVSSGTRPPSSTRPATASQLDPAGGRPPIPQLDPFPKSPEMRITGAAPVPENHWSTLTSRPSSSLFVTVPAKITVPSPAYSASGIRSTHEQASATCGASMADAEHEPGGQAGGQQQGGEGRADDGLHGTCALSLGRAGQALNWNPVAATKPATTTRAVTTPTRPAPHILQSIGPRAGPPWPP